MQQKYQYNFKKADLSKFINIVKTGDAQDVNEAKKQIEYFWKNYYLNNRKEGKEAFEQFLDEIKHFDEIKNDNHKAYFVHALKWAFWAIGDEYFDTWVDFVLQTIQNPSGKIRQAILTCSDTLILSLKTPGSMRFKNDPVPENLARQQQLTGLIRYGLYVFSVEKLIEKHDKPINRKYKYISSFPPGAYKSLQKLMVEQLLVTEYWQSLYEWYLHDFASRTEKVYSGHYSSDLKLLLSSVEPHDYDLVDMLSDLHKKRFGE